MTRVAPTPTKNMGNYFNIINLLTPRLAKTGPFVILLALMPDDFTCQGKASEWERTLNKT